MSVLDDIFGSESTALQFMMWAVFARIADAAMTPFLQQLTQDVSALHPETKLSPDVLADLVVRSYLDQTTAEATARLSGVDPHDFDLLVQGTGEPPAMDFLLEAYRRGLINLDSPSQVGPSLVQGIHESRIKNEWITLINEMRTQVLSAAEWVQANLRGQVDRATALKGAYEAGIKESDFQVMFNTAGNPPSPTQLIELVRRGLIPFKGTGPDALTFEQGIFEGDEKDKWEPLYELLAEYRPPPRTITALERAGVISMQEAQKLYQESGLKPDLAAAYSASATAEKLAPDKALAKTTVLQLYEERMISEADALTDLANLGYRGHEGEFLIALQDAQRSIKAVNQAITRIHTLFVSRKISAATATSNLGTLQVPADQVAHLLQVWTLEQRATVRILTPAQVEAGFHWKNLTQDQAQAKLVALGYSEFDAWLLLSNVNHGKVPNEPPFDDEPAGNVA